MTSQAFRDRRVLLVPGLGLGAESWSPTVRALHGMGMLQRQHTTTALLEGYGLPGRRGGSLAPDVLARRVVHHMPPGPPAVVVALSAGCQVGAHVALQAPERVAGLVLVGPTTDPRAATWPRLVRRWAATARFEPIHQVPVLFRQYRRTGPATMVRAMDAARRDRIQTVLARLSCPILAIRGVHDRIAPEDWIELLTRPSQLSETPGPAVDGSAVKRSVTLSAGAHMVPYTHGGLVAAAVGDFLTRLDR
jgi:pimeloyl-ACP methyl ester carboxylesterase